MSTANFLITVDVPRNLVRMSMTGLFSGHDIASFVVARDQAHLRLRCGPNEHLTLIDIRAMDIQTQDSVAAFQTLLADPHRAAKRLAFVVAQSLARMQTRRIAGSREAGYFKDLGEAERWLLKEED